MFTKDQGLIAVFLVLLGSGASADWSSMSHYLSEKSDLNSVLKHNLGFEKSLIQDNGSLSHCLSKTFKSTDTKHTASASFGKWYATDNFDRDKTNYYLTFGHSVAWKPGRNWQIGFSAYFDYYSYYHYRPTQTEYDLIGSLSLEYILSKKMNLRTYYTGNYLYATRENRDKPTEVDPYQSVGVGWTVSRKVYLYPNLQWGWRNPSVEKTSLSLSATLNLDHL